MSNPLTNWLQNRKFKAALNQENVQLAQELLEKKQIAGAKLSLLEKVFRDRVQFEQSLSNYKREVLVLRDQISQNPQAFEQLTNNYKQLQQALELAHNQVKLKEHEAISIQQRLEVRNQETQDLQNQLKHKEHEVKLIQQQLKIRDKETVTLQKNLAISIEEIEGLCNQLRHKEYEFVLSQQQIEIRNQEKFSLQQELELFRQQSENLSSQIERKEQDFILFQKQLETRNQEVNLLQNNLETFRWQTEKLHNKVRNKEQEFDSIQQQIEAYKQEKQILLNQLSRPSVDNLLLPENEFFKRSVKDKFKFNEINDKLLQCTGIDKEIFYDLEENIVNYLKAQLELYTPKEKLKQHLIDTYEDIYLLQKGIDPEYNYNLTPHIYFMRYFLEGVYSAYLAWFLVYESKLLQTKVSILDIGAGSGAMIYGLFSLFKSMENYNKLPETHLSYCSLEQQNLLQHHGLEFWKQYVEKQNISAANTYYRFKTIDLFTYGNISNEKAELPNNFFDFVVISHCIFADEKQRIKSHQVYRKIFSESLKDDGYVLIIVQGRRLFQSYNRKQTEDQSQEERLIKDFISELGLKLEWYKYMTSTGKRVPSGAKFGIFAKENLHTQPHMSLLLRKYIQQKYDSHYVLDDYAILAKKELCF